MKSKVKKMRIYFDNKDDEETFIDLCKTIARIIEETEKYERALRVSL